MKGYIAATLAACVLAAGHSDAEGHDHHHDMEHMDHGRDPWKECMDETKGDEKQCEEDMMNGVNWFSHDEHRKHDNCGEHGCAYDHHGDHHDGHHDDMAIYDGVSFLMGDAATKISATAAIVAAAALAVSI